MSTLEKLGASPRKSLGQNFLHDNNLARWIVDRLELEPGEHVLEIGPGLGALTECLPVDRVSATLVEKDRLFASFLQERFSGPSLEVRLGDALQYDKRALFCKGEVSWSAICLTMYQPRSSSISPPSPAQSLAWC
jgi:16S rRNA (adenine1518-N6/adenine1519-N6)-dimethyltransferase